MAFSGSCCHCVLSNFVFMRRNLLWFYERSNFVEMLFLSATPQRDVLARLVELIPARVNRQRAQDHVRSAAGLFSDADLRAVDGAHHDIEDIAAREVVELLIEHSQQ